MNRAGLLALLGLAACGGTEPEGPGNILIVIADDMGVDKFGVYGLNDDAPRTPNLDQLAQQGMRFDRATALPACSPARASFLTGRHSRRLGIGRTLLAEHERELSTKERTLPEVLGEAGYTSSIVGKWHLGSHLLEDGLNHPARIGFDWFSVAMANLYSDGPLELLGGTYDYWEQNRNGDLSVRTTYATTATVDDAIERMELMPEPWLLVVSLAAPHIPFHEPPEALLAEPLEDSPSDLELFDAAIEAMDTELGRMFASIPEATRAQTTTVFFGDNGTPQPVIEVFGTERSKNTLFEGGTRVPLIIEGYGVPAAGVTTASVQLLDLLPTLAELAGLDPAGISRLPLDGISLVPQLSDPSQPGRDRVYTEMFGPNGRMPTVMDRRALRDDKFKLISNEIQDFDNLYALDHNGIEGEALDLDALSPQASEALTRLRAELDQIRAEITVSPNVP